MFTNPLPPMPAGRGFVVQLVYVYALVYCFCLRCNHWQFC